MIDYLKMEEYQILLDTFKTMQAMVYYNNLQSKMLYATHGVEKIFGCPKHQFDSSFWEKAIHPEDRDRVLIWKNLLLMSKEASSIQYRIIRGGGEVRWIEDHLTPILNAFGESEKQIGLMIDITDRKKVEQNIEYMAFHDTLTGLPNRNMFNEYVQRALARAKRKNTNMAILFIDLDKFKVINDTLGHEMGDMLLKQVAERLNQCIRDGDIVCRQGGDEFIILLEDAADLERTELIVQRILAVLSKPFQIGREEVHITSSIGVSLYPLHGEDIETLIRNADEAMYIAKDHGTNLYYFYHTDMRNRQVRKMKLEQALRTAIENNELVVYYQPLIDFYTGNIIGMEALLRWFHPILGLVLPLEFIPIAEEYGMIDEIGEWVLAKACAQNKHWQDAGFTPMKIVVNVSNHQFKNPRFIHIIREVLAKTGLAPAYLELDITEGFMQNIDSALPVVQELAFLGVKVSVDDFGTGVFSFNVFNKLPIGHLKIGKDLIHDMSNKNTSTLIKAIIQMGKSLDVKLIAEGIENEEHIEFLKANDCFLGQGNYYSPPVPAEEANELLKSFYGWKSKYGGLEINVPEKIKKYEEENQRLKQLLAELTLETHAIQN